MLLPLLLLVCSSFSSSLTEKNFTNFVPAPVMARGIFDDFGKLSKCVNSNYDGDAICITSVNTCVQKGGIGCFKDLVDSCPNITVIVSECLIS